MVEIVVVVVILGILMGIAAPVWNSRRREARMTGVMGDLKQIESAKARFFLDKAKDSSYVPVEADLVPEYLMTWPKGPFNNGADYAANDGNTRATFKGKSIDDVYADRAAVMDALGF